VRQYPIEGGGAHLANIAVINHQGAEALPISLDDRRLERGRRYVLVNALNPAEAGQAFVHDGAPVTVRLAGLSMAAPAGWTGSSPAPGLPRSVYPRQGVFRLMQVDYEEMIMTLNEQIEAGIAALAAARTAIAEKEARIAELEAALAAAEARHAGFQTVLAGVADALRAQVASIDAVIGGDA
jgi:hypothetical protein